MNISIIERNQIFFFQHLKFYWWFFFQQKLIRGGLKKKSFSLVKHMLYLLRFVHKFIISNSLYLLPNKLLVFGLQITHRAGKKYGIAILLKTKKRYKFFIHYWLYFSKLRFEATFVLKVVAELLDFFNQQGKLYKFIMSIYQIAWDNRFVKPKRK